MGETLVSRNCSTLLDYGNVVPDREQIINVGKDDLTPTVAELSFSHPTVQRGDNCPLSDYGLVPDTARAHISAAVALLLAHTPSISIHPREMKANSVLKNRGPSCRL